MSDTLAFLKDAVSQYEFSLKIRRALTGVRLIDETDEETFARVMRLAQKIICPTCRGYGRTIVSDRPWRDCQGAGECPIRPIRPSDPTRP